jgi:hypothetical protein
MGDWAVPVSFYGWCQCVMAQKVNLGYGMSPMPDDIGDIMTPELLRMAGEAVYGPQWQAPMARALGMTTRHMSRMLNPDYKDRPTERLRPILIAMLQTKTEEVAKALRMLETTDIDGVPIVAGSKRSA